MGIYGTSFIKWSQVCQRSARTHKRINYLAVDGTRRRMCWRRGNDKTLSGRHKLPLGGGLPRRQGLVSPWLARSQTSFHVSKPSLGIWTEKKNQSSIIPPRSHSQTRKEGKCPRPVPPFSLSTVQRPGVMLALPDLLFIIPVKLEASSSPCFYTLLSRDGGWLGLGVEQLFSKALI